MTGKEEHNGKEAFRGSNSNRAQCYELSKVYGCGGQGRRGGRETERGKRRKGEKEGKDGEAVDIASRGVSLSGGLARLNRLPGSGLAHPC